MNSRKIGIACTGGLSFDHRTLKAVELGRVSYDFPVLAVLVDTFVPVASRSVYRVWSVAGRFEGVVDDEGAGCRTLCSHLSLEQRLLLKREIPERIGLSSRLKIAAVADTGIEHVSVSLSISFFRPSLLIGDRTRSRINVFDVVS